MRKRHDVIIVIDADPDDYQSYPRRVSIITYDDTEASWLRRVGSEGVRECSDCGGSGFAECSCCGNETDCETCRGQGWVSRYQEQAKTDTGKFQAWEKGQAIKDDGHPLELWKTP